MGPFEIITSVQRRRRWTPGEKKAIIEKTEQLEGTRSAFFMELRGRIMAESAAFD